MEEPKIRDILDQYYIDNGFPPKGGKDDKSVELKITSWLKLYFPNFDKRREVILKHDLHHMTTGFKTDVKGETEISAWEIASGCRNNWAAMMLNTLGMMTGFPMNIRGIFRAWVKGRQTTNLYHAGLTEDEMVNFTINGLREKLDLSKEIAPAKVMDYLTFIGFLPIGLIIVLLIVLSFPYVLAYTIYKWFSPEPIPA